MLIVLFSHQAMLHYRAVAETRRQRILDVALCVFGIAAMIYTTGQTISSWASSPTKIKTPGYCDE